MLTHTKISCCAKGCYAVITLHPDDDRRLRKTHETFYCPAGHAQSYTGKTDEEKRIEELEKQNGWLHDELGDAYEARNELREALVRGVQVCPFGCGWHGTRQLRWAMDEEALGRFYDRVYTDLSYHLEIVHGAEPKTRKQIPMKTGGAL